MVYFCLYVDKDSLTILCIIPEIKLFSTTFLRCRALISTPGLTLPVCHVDSPRALVVVFVLPRSNIVGQPVTGFTTRIGKFHVRFLKNVGNRSSDRQGSWTFCQLVYRTRSTFFAECCPQEKQNTRGPVYYECHFDKQLQHNT